MPSGRSARAALAMLAAAAVAFTGTACGLQEIVGLGGKTTPPPSGTPGKKSAPGQAAQRVKPTYATPITYRPANAKVFRTTFLNGSVGFTSRPVEYQFGFRVDTDPGQHSLLKQNLESWAALKVKPEKFTVDGGEAYRTERVEPVKTKTALAGTHLFYLAVKDSVAVTLTVFAPKGAPFSKADEQAADGLFNSVKFDTANLSGAATNAAPVPVVPFSYVRPPGLTGGTQAVGGPMYFTELRMTNGQTVRVQLTSHGKERDAHRQYAAERRELDAIAGVDTKDVKRASSTRNTLGRQVDEGFGHLVKQQGVPGHVIEEFTFRKGRNLVSVNADGNNRTLHSSVLNCVTSILTTFRFTRPAL